MDRRSFLRLFGLGAAGAVVGAELDLERLLWVPGQKTIFLPPARGYVWSSELVSPEWVCREMLRIMERQLQFATLVYREYDARAASFTVNIRPRRGR